MSPFMPKKKRASYNFEILYSTMNQADASKGARTKLKIVQAAIECLLKLGPRRLTLEAIANELGLKPAHISYHFKDLDELMEIAVSTSFVLGQQETVKYLKRHHPNPKNPREALLGITEGAVHWLKSNPNNASLLLFFYFLAARDIKHRKLYMKFISVGRARIVEILSPFGFENAELLAEWIQQTVAMEIITYLTDQNLRDATKGTMEKALVQRMMAKIDCILASKQIF